MPRTNVSPNSTDDLSNITSYPFMYLACYAQAGTNTHRVVADTQTILQRFIKGVLLFTQGITNIA